MENQFSRTELILGEDAIQKLHKSKVAIFGLGGVGSFVAEALVRAGVENFVLVDSDKVCLSNLNRQIIATRQTVGKYKVEVMKDRILSINPDAKVETFKEFFMPNSSHDMIDESIDYIADCIDTITAKIELVVTAKKMQIPIISAMGTGNKMDPTRFEVTDIYKTKMCPLAKVMRKELKERNIERLKVVYSQEQPIKPKKSKEVSHNESSVYAPETIKKCDREKQIPGSVSFVPSVCGLIMAGEIIKDMI